MKLYMYRILKRKDAEIEDYKAVGAKVSRSRYQGMSRDRIYINHIIFLMENIVSSRAGGSSFIEKNCIR